MKETCGNKFKAFWKWEERICNLPKGHKGLHQEVFKWSDKDSKITADMITESSRRQ